MSADLPARLETPIFAVVDFHSESRFLLVTTLRRKFPNAVIRELEEADKAVELVRAMKPTAIVAHRTFDSTGVDLVRQLRAADSSVPIIMVSGIDRQAEALTAGATRFVHYDEWLRIGSEVESQLRQTNDAASAGDSVPA